MQKLLLTVVAVFGFMLANAQTPSADSLTAYTGKYKFAAGSPVELLTVVIDNGVLFGTSDQGSSELKRKEGDVFVVVAYNGLATFKRGSDGKVNAIRIEIDDMVLEGTREAASIQVRQ